MPFLRVDAYEGRSKEQVKELLDAIHRPSFRPLEYLCVTATKSIKSTPNRTSSFRTPGSVSIARVMIECW